MAEEYSATIPPRKSKIVSVGMDDQGHLSIRCVVSEDIARAVRKDQFRKKARTSAFPAEEKQP